ncbi:membrane-anchored protein [Sinorhizobium medicae]|uniref:Putative membrane-anchored protein n=1 Tax=Sinorhizobium medicae TaxID=110321 RepID=A0A508X4F2_9HYPH|nr:membrane-anchored protein [Sinorhizobium medicae]MDX0636371.1 membrane-anchored protein [Sinorhizobium medicae]RVI90990.1 membrane-anchored protein [Sinorhizobium medicae]VTZ64674.1 putative membrane-anchored protein [Sinorhizobium medicae]
MGSWISDARKRIYRNLKYRIRRPDPPAAPFRFNSPVVVVGSAPVSNRPAGFDESFRIITVNGSQSVIAKWGVDAPDITMMMFNQVEGTTANAIEVRRVLKGQRTGTLYVFLWRKDDRARLEEGLRAFDYEYDRLEIVDRYERMALLDRVAELRSLEMDADSKCSNGMNAVLFALYNGAPAVIVTGINPNSSGHVYNSTGLTRLHVQMDKFLVSKLISEGHPIFTADPPVSEELGIPLWSGSNR